MRPIEVKRLVFDVLNTAYFKNGFRGVFDKSVEEVTTDLLKNEPTLMNANKKLVYHAVADWQSIVARSYY